MSNILISSYSESNVDADGPIGDNHPSDSVLDSCQGLAFTTPAAPIYAATSFKLYLKKVGSPTGNAVPALYLATGSWPDSVPTGSALATAANFDISTLTTSYALYEFTFNGAYQLKANTIYCIYLQGPASGITWDTDYIAIGNKNASGAAINQIRYTNGSWVANQRQPAYYLYGVTVGGSFLTNFI